MSHENQLAALRLIAHNKVSEVEANLDKIDNLTAFFYGVPKEDIKFLVWTAQALAYSNNSPVAQRVSEWLQFVEGFQP